MLPRYADGSTGSRPSKPKARKRSTSPSKNRKRGKKGIGLIGCCMWTLVLVWFVGAVWFGSTVMLRDKPHDALLGPMIVGPESKFGVMWEETAERVVAILESRHPVEGYAEAQKSLAAYHFERGEYVNLIRQKGAELQDAAQKLFSAVPKIAILNSITSKGANVMRAVGQKVGEKIGEKMAKARMSESELQDQKKPAGEAGGDASKLGLPKATSMGGQKAGSEKLSAPTINEAAAGAEGDTLVFKADVHVGQASAGGDEQGADAAAAKGEQQAAETGRERQAGEEQAASREKEHEVVVDAAGGAEAKGSADTATDGAGDGQVDDKKSVGGEQDVDVVGGTEGGGEKAEGGVENSGVADRLNKAKSVRNQGGRDKGLGRRGALSENTQEGTAQEGVVGMDQRPPEVVEISYKDKPRPWNPKKVAVVIMAYPHETMEELIQTIASLRALPHTAQHDLYVSQDHQNPKMNSFIVKLQSTEAIGHMIHNTPDPSHLHMRERAAQHQRLAMDAIFSKEQGYTHAIFLEDSVKFAPDFFDFFAGGAPLLDRDESIWCVSAWHELGYKEMDWDTSKLMRTTHFSGIAWMARKELWTELSGKWPSQSWIEWMSQDSTRAGRSCVIPEVSRVERIGNPVYSREEARFERFNAKVRLSDLLSEKMTFVETSYVLKEQYDAYLSGSVRRAKKIDNPMRAEVPANSFGPFLLEYDPVGFPVIARKYGLPDTPLGDYEGLTILKLKGNLILLARKDSKWVAMKNDVQ